MKKVALLGFGTVGSGVEEVLRINREQIAKNIGEEVELKYILDIRDFSGTPYEKLVVSDISIIENDPEVVAAAECIGGATIAYTFVKRLLLAGKSVVTSNKELVATKGLELQAIAREKGVCFLFEASVGGGIPIIRPLTNDLAANRIDEVFGIVNGTTNYILFQMLQCGKDFDTALREAQANGYAEADPTADIEGIDACRKICILSDLCFGKNVSPESVSTRGITCVTAEDTALAEKLGYAIKLIARAKRVGEGVSTYVAPHLISSEKLLANVSGVMNAVVVRGNAVGDCLFYGAGAGKLPTASAVVADLLDAVSGRAKSPEWDEAPEGYAVPSSTLSSCWYVRADKSGGLDAKFDCVYSDNSCAAIIPECDEAALSEVLAGIEIKNALRIIK
ncbi:MAG: homoserine dehydrogenase [Oscillospiraceae bacterium]|nr:homoserine dehydrogenase [Oscillospiraceae bacterium]